MSPKTHLIYFSPTGTTSKIVKQVAAGLDSRDVEHHDLTRMDQEFSLCLDDGLAVIGVPVYAGRVPEIFLKRIENLSGEGIPAILLVLYGNRAYEDALVELRDVITAKGFNVIAAGAFIGEHSYSTDERPVAANRPDAGDMQKAREFGAAITNKLQGECNQTTLDIPGNTPYKERVPLGGICPETKPELCTLCKTCARVYRTYRTGDDSWKASTTVAGVRKNASLPNKSVSPDLPNSSRTSSTTSHNTSLTPWPARVK